jgi:hypothetical protein
VPLVEAACPFIGLERPEREAARHPLLCVVEQPRSNAATSPPDIEIQVHQLAVAERQEPANTTFVPCPDLLVQDHTREPRAVLVDCVENGQEPQRREGALVKLSERVDVLWRRSTDHPRESMRVLMATVLVTLVAPRAGPNATAGNRASRMRS